MKAACIPRITASTFLCASALLISTGCGGNGGTPKAPASQMPTSQPDSTQAEVTPPTSEVVLKLESIVTTACACKDADCVSKEWKAIETLAQTYPEATENDTSRMSELLTQMDQCGSAFPSKRVKMFSTIKEKICACKSTACVERTSKEFSKFEDQKDTNDLERRQIMKLANDMSICVALLAADGN